MDNVQKGKNVGPDGLTKKERRALKISATTSNSKPKEESKEPPINNALVNKIVQNKPSDSTKEQVAAASNTNQVLSKHEIKAQRRALQEAQRIAKANAKNNEQNDKKELSKNIVVNKTNGELSKAELKLQRKTVPDVQRLTKVEKKPEKADQEKPQIKKLSAKKDVIKNKIPFFFNHLCFQNMDIFNVTSVSNVQYVHAAFLRLGSQYSSKTILGSNARCLALLSALKCLINDFTTPPKQEFCRSLETVLQSCMIHLHKCRPLAVSMTNALRHFKLYLTQINTNLSDNEKKIKLKDCIDTYINEEIFKAGEAISLRVTKKICNGDVILIYGCSSLIKKILLDAHSENKTFKVIIVDSRPMLEGMEMLRMLVCAGLQCTYILINAVSFIMSRVSKVLLGAHALLANGYVMSRTGTAQIALIANSYNKPVLVCCETYKFSERVQTDSFVYNEIGDPNQLVTLQESSPLANWQDNNYLAPLNLMYDVTPPDFVTAVVTELAFLPCTSVPVILRIRPTEIIT